jgi:hypothetical protein
MGDGRYWSIEHCGWVPSPAAPDALATPWAGHEVVLPDVPHPQDALDLLQARPRSGALPAQRGVQAPARTEA